MSIQPGETIPDVPIAMVGAEPPSCHTGALFAGRKAVLFGVPGAFTPTCSTKHLPGVIHHFAEFQRRGITPMCLAVNDVHVMRAWAVAQSTPPGLLMLADGNAAFTGALGLAFDGTGYGMGVRSRRFALYAEDGVVRLLQVEAPGEFRVSSAESILAAINAAATAQVHQA